MEKHRGRFDTTLAERRELIMSHDLTALYEILNRDDKLQAESNSISNQDEICQG